MQPAQCEARLAVSCLLAASSQSAKTGEMPGQEAAMSELELTEAPLTWSYKLFFAKFGGRVLDC